MAIPGFLSSHCGDVPDILTRRLVGRCPVTLKACLGRFLLKVFSTPCTFYFQWGLQVKSKFEVLFAGFAQASEQTKKGKPPYRSAKGVEVKWTHFFHWSNFDPSFSFHKHFMEFSRSNKLTWLRRSKMGFKFLSQTTQVTWACDLQYSWSFPLKFQFEAPSSSFHAVCIGGYASRQAAGFPWKYWRPYYTGLYQLVENSRTDQQKSDFLLNQQKLAAQVKLFSRNWGRYPFIRKNMGAAALNCGMSDTPRGR